MNPPCRSDRFSCHARVDSAACSPAVQDVPQRRDKKALSKSASTATLFPAWKQEVNRRVAAHMSQQDAIDERIRASQDSRSARGSRAAQAAARVAERYAQAPSYSEMLADEARAAMRAAEAASKAAQQAQAAVQYVLDGLEAAAAPEFVTHSESEAIERARVSGRRSILSFSINAHRFLPQTGRSRPASGENEPMTAKPWRHARPLRRRSKTLAQRTRVVPIYANLIQFPRHMVATRRMRPRRAEGPLASAPAQSQLSIFEVDPGSISTQPAPRSTSLPRRCGCAPGVDAANSSRDRTSSFSKNLRPRATQGSIRLAPLNLRLMALAVDASLDPRGFLSLARCWFLTPVTYPACAPSSSSRASPCWPSAPLIRRCFGPRPRHAGHEIRRHRAQHL